MAGILFAWELGGGLAHVVRFERLGRELELRGHVVSVALSHSLHAARFNFVSGRVKIVPAWPGLARSRRRDQQEISWFTYGDMLADIIFTDSEEIADHLVMWRSVFRELSIDVIVADYAPGAVLAARDCYPVVNIGDGYTLPPHDMDSFPPLWPHGVLKHPENDVAERINVALTKLGAPPLLNYPDMNAADAHATMTIPLLDVYRNERMGGWLGAGPFTRSRKPAHERSGSYTYLHENDQFDQRLMQGVAGAGVGGMIYLPNLLRKNRKVFSGAGTVVAEDPPVLDEVLNDVSAVVHKGGMGVSNAAIAKGVPQIVIHDDLEKYHTGKAIAAAGAGLDLDRRSITAAGITEAIQAVLRDPSYARNAMRLAEENHALLSTSSIAALADLAEQTLGTQPMPHIRSRSR